MLLKKTIFQPSHLAFMGIRIFCLLVIICGLSSLSWGQTTEGTMVLGGNGNISINASSNQERILTASISPNLFVFVNDKLAVGGNFELGLLRYLENRYNSLGIFPTARYYFGSLRPVRIFLLGDFGYHLTSYTINKEGEGKSGLGLGGGAGLAFFFSEMVSIEGLAKVRAIRYTNGTNSANLQLRIGVQLYLKPQRRF